MEKTSRGEKYLEGMMVLDISKDVLGCCSFAKLNLKKEPQLGKWATLSHYYDVFWATLLDIHTFFATLYRSPYVIPSHPVQLLCNPLSFKYVDDQK